MLIARQLHAFVRAPFDFKFNLLFANQKRGARRKGIIFRKGNQAAFVTDTRRAALPHQQLSHCFVVFNHAMRANDCLQLRRAISVQS
jgi:hypothetical protein